MVRTMHRKPGKLWPPRLRTQLPDFNASAQGARPASGPLGCMLCLPAHLLGERRVLQGFHSLGPVEHGQASHAHGEIADVCVEVALWTCHTLCQHLLQHSFVVWCRYRAVKASGPQPAAQQLFRSWCSSGTW